MKAIHGVKNSYLLISLKQSVVTWSILFFFVLSNRHFMTPLNISYSKYDHMHSACETSEHGCQQLELQIGGSGAL